MSQLNEPVEPSVDGGLPSPSARGTARAQRVLDRAVATETAILDAAVDVMMRHGYHGTSVRQIADRAGMSVANVYHYFSSKHEILFRLMDENAKHLIGLLEDLVERSRDDPAERLSAAVRLFVLRHIAGQRLAFVTSTEVRSLEPDARRVVVAERTRIEEIFRTIVQDGHDAGTFEVEDAELATRVILDMTRSVSAWYRANGPKTPEELADYYATLSLRVVGARASER